MRGASTDGRRVAHQTGSRQARSRWRFAAHQCHEGCPHAAHERTEVAGGLQGSLQLWELRQLLRHVGHCREREVPCVVLGRALINTCTGPWLDQVWRPSAKA